MEVMLAASFLNTYWPKMWNKWKEANEKKKQLEQSKLGIDLLLQELGFLAANIQDCESSCMEDMDSEKTRWICTSRWLAQEIEDHIEIALHPRDGNPKSSEIIMKTEHLMERLKSIKEHKPTTSGAPTTTSTSKVDQKVVPDPVPYLPEHIYAKEPLTELLEFVLKDEEPQKEADKMKVIAIVGFGGLGKTLRANQVYQSAQVKAKFKSRVWVCAGGMSAADILKKIREKLGCDGQQHITDVQRIKAFLRNKRYFIVIDDMRERKQWQDIEDAFPSKLSSRIIVTTAMQSVAQACCRSSGGYVYKLLPLSEDQSVNLLVSRLCLTSSEQKDAADDAVELLKVCEGLPLALISLSRYFESQDDGLSGGTCEVAYRELGAYLIGDKKRDLVEIRQVLVDTYTALDRHILKACLLYFSMFLHNHQTTRNHLVRRWVAEGFSSEYDAVQNFKSLVDRNVIQTMEVSSNGHAKRCQPPGIMHKYIFYKATSENFVTESPAENKTNGYKKASEYSHVRRLCVNLSHEDGESLERMDDLTFVRALQVSGKADKPILKFGGGTGNNYKLLRVLELKDYDNLTSKEVDNICDHLLLLRYLSLGESIKVIRRNIGNLTLLETLHMTRTEAVSVPSELILLPSLTHLLGKFQLYDEGEYMTIYKKIISKSSKREINLERLSGFVAAKKGFPELVPHMERLTKVKLWCDDRTADHETLSKAIKGFIRKGSRTSTGERSLSVHFSGCSTPFKDSDEYPGRLTSLKLKGKMMMGRFPQFLELNSVRKLCLSSTELTWVLIEEGVGQFTQLNYLKLYEDDLHGLAPAQEDDDAPKDTPSVGKVKPFQKLQRICFSAKTRLPPPTILRRLHYLAAIKEVNLYSIQALDEQSRRSWKQAARDHPRRPMVWFGAPPQAS